MPLVDVAMYLFQMILVIFPLANSHCEYPVFSFISHLKIK